MKTVKCYNCGKEFVDKYYDPKLPLAERIYCDECVDELIRIGKSSSSKQTSK